MSSARQHARFVLLTLLVLTGAISAHARRAHLHPLPDTLTTALLDQPWVVFHVDHWKFSPGDDPQFADPDFDDSSWREHSGYALRTACPDGEWPGMGWFRRTIDVAEELVGEPMALGVTYVGAIELLLNGQRIVQRGAIDPAAGTGDRLLGHSFEPIEFTFHEPGRNVLAVRYALFDVGSLMLPGLEPGIHLELGRAERVRERAADTYLHGVGTQSVFTVIAASFALLHLLLYFFYPIHRSNLYYAMFVASVALLVFSATGTRLVTGIASFTVHFHLLKTALILIGIFGLRFAYALLGRGVPKQYGVFIVLGAILLAFTVYVPQEWVFVYSILSITEFFRVLILAKRRRIRDIRFIYIGGFAFGSFGAYHMLVRMLPVPESMRIPDVYLVGVFAFMVATTIYLARQIARSDRSLNLQIAEVGRLTDLAVEQERRAREREMHHALLEAESVHKEQQVAEARKIRSATEQLEISNKNLRETRAQLVHSEKMASMGMLVAGVAHEINSPVGAMSSMHNTLVRAVDRLRAALSESREESLLNHPEVSTIFGVIDDANRVIADGAERVNTIVRRLRSFARLDEADRTRADVHEGLEDTLLLLYHDIKHNITVHRRYGDLPPIICYPGQLNQVFLNLLVNAKQAMPDGGEITITTEIVDHHVQIRIADTGSGIPPEILPRIFETGFTTKEEEHGTGLGLSIVDQIIKDHQGEIRVESELGVGTTFTILLPLDPDNTNTRP